MIPGIRSMKNAVCDSRRFRIRVAEVIGDASSGVRGLHNIACSEVWEFFRRIVLAVFV